ncbi:MAG: glycosyltransferase family 4 protein [Fervidobacterium sp.]
MNFCFVSEIAPYRINKEVIITGGGEAHAFFLSRELAKRGHIVKIVTARWKNAPKREFIDGVELIRYGHYAPWFERSLLTTFGNTIRNTVGCFKILETLIKKDKPDFIITPMTFAFPRAFLLAKMYKIPLIAEVHDVYEMPLYLQHYKNDYGWLVYPGALYVWIYNNLPAYADLVETVSLSNIDPLVKEYGVNRERIHVTGNGIDLEKYAYSTEKQQVIVSLGRLVSYKRIDKVIRIFKEVKERISNVRLLIVGDGPERKKLEALASNDIKFLGFVSEEQKIAILRKAKILISCSEFEGFGMAPIEGLACGAYPVLSAIPAHKEIIGDHGYLFRSIDQAVQRICELLSDEKQRENLSRIGRKFVESKFTWDNVCNNFLHMISEFNRLRLCTKN